MRRSNPKQFYKMFRKKRNTARSNLTAHDFFEYFSKLMSGEQTGEQQNSEKPNSIFHELDTSFSSDEISEQIHNLKKDKAPGIDGLLNEMFSQCEVIFLPILTKLFNHIL